MLEIRNVTKIYRSKSGNEVKALDNVSVTFPETGMVFILGKSGSGKSTLLNVIGGLDGCDSGEFIIKGKSSKDFAGSDFDAYRNTFIGFIFQEYNILDDFTVGANIGLALELQGKKATNEKITEILTQVELTEYAKRKPNELSGGQKQRIAIARALVKDPEIIMADEPTGALDSNTGKQIFDTLKQLSRTKLVVIVSHDRDFAERYADRIIEMKDGQIDSDVTKHEVDAKAVSSGILQMNDNLLKIEKGYQLTAKDVELINEYLRTRETDIIVSGDKRLNDSVRNVAGISQDNKSSVFAATNPAKDVNVKQYDGKQTRFIRSSLPMKNAVKMGSSSLGHKKVRLVFTIFLSLIAFALFGFADTLGAYDKVTAATNSIVDTGIKNASFSVGVKYEAWSKGKLQSTDYEASSMNESDLSALNQKLGINFTPVFNGSTNMNAAIPITENMKTTSSINNQAYEGKLYGFAPITNDKLSELGFEITGVLPATDNEIAISKFMYEQFKANGFRNSRENEEVSADNLTMEATGANSIIGKHLTMRVGMGEYTYKITAVIDTKFEYDRYSSYIPSANDTQGGAQGGDEGNALIDMVMLKELANTLHYGYHCLGYTTQGAITTMSRNMEKWYSESSYIGESMYWNAQLKNDNSSSDFGGGGFYLGRVGNSELIPSLGNITWLNGAKTALGEKEMLVPADVLNQALNNASVNKYDALIATLQQTGYYDENYTNDINMMIERIARRVYAKQIVEAGGERLEKARAEHWESDPTDVQMVEFIADNLPYSPNTDTENWRYGLKTQYEVVGAMFKELINTIYGIDLSAYPNISDQTAYYAFNYHFNVYEDKDENMSFTVSAQRLVEVYAKLYAFNTVYATESTLHNDQSFVENVVKHFYGIDIDDYFDDEKYNDARRRQESAQAYSNYLTNQYNNVSYGDVSYSDMFALAMPKYLEISGSSYADLLSGFYLSTTNWVDGNEVVTDYRDYTIVGFFPRTEMTNSLLVSDTFYNAWCQYRDEEGYYTYKYAPHEAGIYAFAIAPMGNDTEFIRKLVEMSYDESENIRFELQNQVMDTLSMFNDFIEMGSKIFIYVGLGFALFASLMMMNFISTSISYKRREIGILRAVGARSSDVFKIFFSEALIIALINYVLSIIATISAIKVLNYFVRQEGLNVTLLNFGIRQIVLMLAVSVFVAALSSFLPVWNIAKRKPVDAIKNT